MRKNRYPQDLNRPVNWRVLLDLLPYLRTFKGRIALALGCLILAKLATVALPFILKHAVDALDTPTTQAALIVVPVALILAYGALRLATTLFGEIRDTLFGRVTERAMRTVGLKAFSHLHSMDLGFHLNRQTGGLARDIERGTSGIGFLMRFMIFNIVPTLLEIALVVGLLYNQYGWHFAAIILTSVLGYILWSVKATHWRTEAVQQMNQADSASHTQALDSLINFETVKYFNNEAFEAKRYDQTLAHWEKSRRKNRLSLFVLNAGQAFIIAAAMTAMMLMAARGVSQGKMTLGDFVLINAFSMQLFMPLNFLGFVYREIRGALANIEGLFKLLSLIPAIKESATARDLSPGPGRVEFINVDFGYDQQRPIFKGLNLVLEPGQTVAVVGRSGAGKSTLVKLLFRFYDPQAGSIRIDNQDIRELTLDSLRRRLGMVPQDTVLFNASIGENIAYGDVKASPEAIRRVVSLAQLDDFVAALPDGLDTLVGERGLKLSGGEKQRVAIARALLKRPPIMIFDEATASLDSHSEDAIMQAIRAAAAGHTSLIIAHRLSTVVDADNIVMLKDGKVVEQGSHSALLNLNGHYAALWAAQQRGKH